MRGHRSDVGRESHHRHGGGDAERRGRQHRGDERIAEELAGGMAVGSSSVTAAGMPVTNHSTSPASRSEANTTSSVAPSGASLHWIVGGVVDPQAKSIGSG